MSCTACESQITDHGHSGSQLWTVLSLKEARTLAKAVQASKSRHNSKTKPLIAILQNLFFIKILRYK